MQHLVATAEFNVGCHAVHSTKFIHITNKQWASKI